jgi:thiamine biosynthesis lipoprotein
VFLFTNSQGGDYLECGTVVRNVDSDIVHVTEAIDSMVVTLAREAMRTRFEIVLDGQGAAPADLRAAGEEALDEIERVEQWLSAYRPDAVLYAINTYAAVESVPVSPPVLAFLRRARELSTMTNGAFDLTVGPLLRIWGLGGGMMGGQIPTEAEIELARESVGMARVVHLDEDAGTVAFNRPGARLDPGAIGKGYALERAANLLRDVGIHRALLHGGTSTVCAIGSGWKVALQHPTRADAHLAVAELNDASLSVSAVHGKTFHAQGRTFGHVIDPRTGHPVENTLLAAVVAPSATDTDALSTALLVLGATGISLLTERFPDVAGYLVAEDEPNTEDKPRVTRQGDVWGGIRD